MLNVCRGAFAAQWLSPVCSLSSAVVSSQPVPRVADKVKLVDIPMAETILNPCTNELVVDRRHHQPDPLHRVQRTGALVVTCASG